MKTTNNTAARRTALSSALSALRRTAFTARRCLCLLAVASLSLVPASCTPDDDDDPGKTGNPITITALRTEILAPGADTRAFNDADLDDKGYAPGGVKVKFVAGDVLHFIVIDTETDYMNDKYHLSTATLGSDGRTWTFALVLTLPQDASTTYMAMAFYDGKTTAYTKWISNGTDGYEDPDNFYRAFMQLSAPTTAPDGTASYHDAIGAEGTSSNAGFDGSTFSLASDGTLTLSLSHANALVRISGISNQLAAAGTQPDAIVGISANLTAYNGTPVATVPLTADGTPQGIGQWRAICGTKYLQSLTVRLGTPGTPANPDGTGGTPATVTQTVTVPVPAAPDRPDDPGRRLTTGCSYTYRLTLLPGSASVATEENGTPDAWEAQRDPAVPAGYIPIYTAEELRKVGRAISGSGYSAVYETATVNGYTYTTTADATGQHLTYSLNAKYILMADIDLTPTLPNGQRGVRNIAVTPPVLGADGKVTTDAQLDDANFKTDMAALKPGSGTPSKELWTPIGSSGSGNYFTGHFNGNGHTITGMTIHSDAQYVGLFGYAYDALIYNLHLRDARVKGTYSSSSSRTGTLVGFAGGSNNSSSNISLCSATGCTVQAALPDAGGLTGYNSSYSTLTHCHATGCIVSSGDTNYAAGTGGLMGTSDGTAVACYTSGCTVQGKYVGGLAGYFTANALYGCYAADASAIKIATSSSNCYSGTLVGYAYNNRSNSGSPAAIASCYATNAGGYTTGLMGFCDNNTQAVTLTACISPFQSSQSPGASDASTTGYTPLIPDATTGGTLSGLHSGGKTLSNGSSFNSDGNLTNVPTVVVNATTGALEVQKLTWKASRIWKGLHSATPPVTSAPYIDWTYAGGD